jgi:hypothetical protein
MLLLTFLGGTLVLFVLGVTLVRAGVRLGDRVGDVRLTEIASDPFTPGFLVAVHNPSGVSVLVGLSVRRRSLRLWSEGGAYAESPAQRNRRALLAGAQTTIGVVEAGATVTLAVPFPARPRRRAQVVAVVGQGDDRLRVIHRRARWHGSRVGAEARTQIPV